MTEQVGQSDAERALAHAEREAAAEAAADRSEPEPAEDEADPGGSLSPGPEPVPVIDAEPEPAMTTAPGSEPPAEGDDSSTVRAERVDLRQGGATRIDATTVSLTQGGASRINARDVSIKMGGAVLVRTDALRLEDGAAAVAVVAGRAQVAPGARILVLISRQTSTEVRPVIDWRTALAAVGGYLLFRRILGRRRGR